MSISCEIAGDVATLSCPGFFPLKVDKSSFELQPEDEQAFESAKTLKIYDEQIKKIPEGLGEIFPKIETLVIEKTNLEQISKFDLKQFPNLKRLDALECLLEYLPGDLFEFSKKIEEIDFWDSEIKFIGITLLDGLENLKKASFRSNLTIDEEFQLPEELEVARVYFLLHCEPPKILQRFTETSAEDFLKIVHEKREIQEKFESLEGDKKDLEERVRELRRKNENMRTRMRKKSSKTRKLWAKNRNLKENLEENRNLKENLETNQNVEAEEIFNENGIQLRYKDFDALLALDDLKDFVVKVQSKVRKNPKSLF